MHTLRVKVLPRANLLGGWWYGQDSGFAIWRKLTQRFFMAVVGLVLRDQDEVWLERELFEMWNAWLVLLLRDGEDRTQDNGGAHKPGVEKNGEGAWKQSGGGEWSGRGREDKPEGSVTVQRLDRQRHGRWYAERIALMQAQKT